MRMTEDSPSGDLVSVAFDVLSWAVAKGEPLGAALSAITGTDSPRRASHSLSKRACVESLQYELAAGMPLDRALESWLHAYLPTHIFRAVEAAMENGVLPEALPKICENVRTCREARSKYASKAVFYPFLELVPIVCMASFFQILFLPKLYMVFDAFLYGRNPLRLLFLNGKMVSVVLAVAGVAGLLMWAFMIMPRGRLFQGCFWTPFQWLLERAPVAGRWFKRGMMEEASGAMGTLLFAGMPMEKAARAASKAASKAILSKRFERFAARVEAGEDWMESFDRELDPDRFSKWMLHSGRDREFPQESFIRLNSWLVWERAALAPVMDSFLEIAGIFLNAAIVALFTMILFASLAIFVSKDVTLPFF